MNNKGFTLIELMVVITIIALLTVITTPAYDTISGNIKKQNYNTKKETIKTQTISYIEKYFKDVIYDGTANSKYPYSIGKVLCFTPEYLIKNGIIISDSETQDYIENNATSKRYTNEVYIKLVYDYKAFKMQAIIVDDDGKINLFRKSYSTSISVDFNTLNCDITDLRL